MYIVRLDCFIIDNYNEICFFFILSCKGLFFMVYSYCGLKKIFFKLMFWKISLQYIKVRFIYVVNVFLLWEI